MDILLEIGDSEEKKYQALVLQRVINTLRDINVNMSNLYEEVPVILNGELNFGKYPNNLIELLSVGIYKDGEFWSFTHKPNMAKTTSGIGEGYDTDIGEGEKIPNRGFNFGARGSNIGYWVEDDNNRRFRVVNYNQKKVIIKYKSNGISCTGETCIPYIAKDLIMSMVKFSLAIDGIPKRFTAAELNYKERERERFKDQYTDLLYLPGNLDEFMDIQFSTLSNVPRRG